MDRHIYIIQIRFLEFRSEKREASELFKERARARAHAALSFATYPSRLSHTCTCLFSLQIITEKIELESLENAEIRFLSSWSFIYLFACSGTRLIHIYLWFMQIWLYSFLSLFVIRYLAMVLILVICVLCLIYIIFVKKKKKKAFVFSAISCSIWFQLIWSHQAFFENFGSDLVYFWRKVYMGLL